MKHKAELTRSIPQHDYGPALQSAVSWLGDRYLLAEPVPRRKVEYKPYFSSPRSWLEASRSPRVSSKPRLAH
jgi:hypothetical protein